VKNKKRRVLPVAIALMAIIALSGVAYAYWSSSGTGTGSATVGTSVALTATQTNTITGLVPGGSAPVDVTVTNPATFHQSFTQVVITVTATSAVGCDPLWFPGSTVTAVPNPTVLAAAPGPGNTAALVGSVSMTDLAGTNQDACKTTDPLNPVTLTLHFAIS
jgi:hypothetical protein